MKTGREWRVCDWGPMRTLGVYWFGKGVWWFGREGGLSVNGGEREKGGRSRMSWVSACVMGKGPSHLTFDCRYLCVVGKKEEGFAIRPGE